MEFIVVEYSLVVRRGTKYVILAPLRNFDKLQSNAWSEIGLNTIKQYRHDNNQVVAIT